MVRINTDKAVFEERGGVPDQGDWIEWQGDEILVARVHIYNGQEVQIQGVKRQEEKEVEKPTRPGTEAFS